MAVHRRRSPDLLDESPDVLYLALDGVRHGVAAAAPAPTLVVEHGETLCQFLGRRAHQGPVAHLAAHRDDRRAIAHPVEGDAGAVSRSHRFHAIILIFSCVVHVQCLGDAGGISSETRHRPTASTVWVRDSPCGGLWPGASGGASSRRVPSMADMRSSFASQSPAWMAASARGTFS